MLRQRWGLPAVKLSPTGANPPRWPDGSYSVQGAAAAIGVTTQVIFDYLANGLLTGRQLTKGQPWQIDLTIEQNRSVAATPITYQTIKKEGIMRRSVRERSFPIRRRVDWR